MSGKGAFSLIAEPPFLARPRPQPKKRKIRVHGSNGFNGSEKIFFSFSYPLHPFDPLNP
jgi:hypothetical protein